MTNLMKSKEESPQAGEHLNSTEITTKVAMAGHVARMNDDRWTRTVTEWLPLHLKRKQARPKMRWEDDIKKFIGVTWMRVARDRKDWKHREEAFIQQWIDNG